MSNNKLSTVEIIDDGDGMDEDDLGEKYAIIGRNRRKYDAQDNATGRKGIGKLAALYLSDEYQIISIKNEKTTAWSVNVKGKRDDDIPCMEKTELSLVTPICDKIWDGQHRKHGTMLRLLNVDLNRIGTKYIEALKHKLSNYFLYNSLERALHICIINKQGGEIVFEEVKKQIAFDNMVHIYYSDESLLDVKKPTFNVDYIDKSQVRQIQKIQRTKESFPIEVAGTSSTEKVAISGEKLFYDKIKPYKLEGWIGIHSSIETDKALENDNRYIKNNYYNPNQIRIYIRNKLANENILKSLNLTGAFGVYIEGEVSFDILDDNEFEDIATANRQDFSFNDERVILLHEILSGLCKQLISKRQVLANKINESKKNTDNDIQSKQKGKFAQEMHDDLLSSGIPEEKANELSYVIANKLKGDYDIKTSYKLFISHSAKDRIFTDFVSNYLKKRGFIWDIDGNKTEIFYSSDGTNITDEKPLAEIIKKMIIDNNTDILFVPSQNFMDSEYCLFEGGAAWATRSVVEYSMMALDYEKIPKFLTNGKSEFTFDLKNKKSFDLNEQNYSNIITILNRFILHLNKNRLHNALPEVEEIPEPEFVDRVQMAKEGKELKDYMDKDVYDYWDIYVIKQIDEYLKNLPVKN